MITSLHIYIHLHHGPTYSENENKGRRRREENCCPSQRSCSSRAARRILAAERQRQLGRPGFALLGQVVGGAHGRRRPAVRARKFVSSSSQVWVCPFARRRFTVNLTAVFVPNSCLLSFVPLAVVGRSSRTSSSRRVGRSTTVTIRGGPPSTRTIVSVVLGKAGMDWTGPDYNGLDWCLAEEV